MSIITKCDGGCGELLDAMNESPDVQPTTLSDAIVDPFTGAHYMTCYCQTCADRLFPGWRDQEDP